MIFGNNFQVEPKGIQPSSQKGINIVDKSDKYH
jgi:hypothetical protein